MSIYSYPEVISSKLAIITISPSVKLSRKALKKNVSKTEIYFSFNWTSLFLPSRYVSNVSVNFTSNVVLLITTILRPRPTFESFKFLSSNLSTIRNLILHNIRLNLTYNLLLKHIDGYLLNPSPEVILYANESLEHFSSISQPDWISIFLKEIISNTQYVPGSTVDGRLIARIEICRVSLEPRENSCEPLLRRALNARNKFVFTWFRIWIFKRTLSTRKNICITKDHSDWH